jgi:hypothetical protein
LRLAAGALAAPVGSGFGASAAVRIAVTRSGMPSTAKLQRQEPFTSASSGTISITPSVSPTRSPLVQTAVPKVTRRGIHCWISGGSAGCITEMPALITTVAA